MKANTQIFIFLDRKFFSYETGERLKNKVAVITGAGAGIGRETALLFAHQGVQGLVLADNNQEKVDELAQIIKNLGVDCIAVKADVSKAEDCKHMIEAGEDTFGHINIIFNNAGIMHMQVRENYHFDRKYLNDLVLFVINIKVIHFSIICSSGRRCN